MKAREVALNIVTAIAAALSISLTVATLRQNALSSRGVPGRSATASSRPVSGWKTLIQTGRRIGPENAALTIIEFGDFECPACSAFARVLDSVRARHPNDFAIAFHHLPLPYHKLAYPLARASECAADQGAFPAFHDFVYAHRDLLPTLSAAKIGLAAGVPDSARFLQCASDTSRVAAIDADIDIARKLGVPGTPGVVIDGMLRGNVPLRVSDIEEVVERHVLAQRR